MSITIEPWDNSEIPDNVLAPQQPQPSLSWLQGTQFQNRGRELYQDTILPKIDSSSIGLNKSHHYSYREWVSASLDQTLKMTPIGPGWNQKGALTRWATLKAWNDPDSWWGKMVIGDADEYLSQDIEEEEFEGIFGGLGLEWKKGMTWGEAMHIHAWKLDELDKQQIIADGNSVGRTLSFLPVVL